MVIINKSFYNIMINCKIIEPGQKYVIGEMAFDSKAIYSEHGSIEIITEQCKRRFVCEGNRIEAKESEYNKDANGFPWIVVYTPKSQRLLK